MSGSLFTRISSKKSFRMDESAEKKFPRVLIAAGIYPPDPGGPATHAKKYVDSFRELGIRTDVVVFSRLNNFPFGIRHAIYFFKLLIAGIRCDIFYAQDISSVGFPAYLAAKCLGRKLVVRAGGDIVWERLAERGEVSVSMREFYESGPNRNNYLFKLGKIVLENADKINVPAGSLREIYTRYYGIDSSKIIVIPNPVPEKSAYSETDERTLVFASRFVKYKNLMFLIDAFSRVYEKVKPAKLVLIGDGPEEERLIAKSKEYSASIEFAGKISHDEVMKKIGNCHACIAPALTEFNPNYILECLSFGKPFLINKENGLSVKVPDELLFDVRDHNELEDKLVWLFSRSGYKEAVEFVRHIPAGPTWDEVIDKNLAILKKI